MKLMESLVRDAIGRVIIANKNLSGFCRFTKADKNSRL